MSGVDSVKVPVDSCCGFIALGLKHFYLSSQLRLIRYPASQSLLAEHAQLYLRHPFGKLRTGFSQLPCFGV